MIKYLGSKRLLLPRIVSIARSLPRVRTALDLFSGTARVGHALKGAGLHVTANDHNSYAATLARAYVGADARRVRGEVVRVIAHLSTLKGKPKGGWFTEQYAERAHYIHPKNTVRIERVRNEIARLSLDPDVEAVALVSLMEAADRVDSTVGVQMAYLKQWAARAHNELALRVPDILDGPGRALGLDALEAAREVGDVDLAYLDPPYNQHSYRGNYHVWETLVCWDQPTTYGIARKRIDVRTHKSDYNFRAKIRPALAALLDAVRARFVLLSFNDEGYLALDDLRGLLATHGRVIEASVDFPRYVGAKIGIHNLRGEKVGKVSHLRNREHLFLVDRDGELPKQFSLDASSTPDRHLRP